MEEIKKLKANLKGFGERKRGAKDDGTEWILYEYTLLLPDGKEKGLTGFNKCPELLGEGVEVEYKQVPRESGEGYYNNLISIEKTGESEQAKKEADKKYNVTTVKDYNIKIDDKIFFGQILNLTLAWIMNERRINKEYTLDEHFDLIFDHIWEKALKKRKEKIK